MLISNLGTYLFNKNQKFIRTLLTFFSKSASAKWVFPSAYWVGFQGYLPAITLHISHSLSQMSHFDFPLFKMSTTSVKGPYFVCRIRHISSNSKIGIIVKITRDDVWSSHWCCCSWSRSVFLTQWSNDPNYLKVEKSKLKIKTFWSNLIQLEVFRGPIE